MMKFLEGNYQPADNSERPADNSERLALLGVCQAEDRWRAAARLFADAFQSDPALPDRLTEAGLGRMPWREGTMNPVDVYRSSSRYGAARCAALAGCGLGKDGADLSALERTHWRKQARKWLEDDLAMWTRTLDSDLPRARALAMEILTNWESAQDLAGLREPHALDALSADERTECLALWRKVRNVLQGGAARQQVRRAAMPDPKGPASK
jgi:eukaryotic-like serine/threonine-protein kinase